VTRVLQLTQSAIFRIGLLKVESTLCFKQRHPFYIFIFVRNFVKCHPILLLQPLCRVSTRLRINAWRTSRKRYDNDDIWWSV